MEVTMRLVIFMERIYCDHAATSPVHPTVIKAMQEALNDTFGNPSSVHSFGRSARHIIDEARQKAAKSIGASFNEIIFTSGGTEADNLAIIGTALANKDKGKHIITTEIEHHAVLHTCEFLEEEGFEVTYLPVNESGFVSISDLKQALRDDTILVTIMFGNNEVGTIQPIKEIGELLSTHQAYLHTDAVQAYGLVDINVLDLKVDLLSVSAHKINGPKGIGFLYIKNGTKIRPIMHGGEQERKRRAGTENAYAIAGFKEAIQIAMDTRNEKASLYSRFKQKLVTELENQGIEFYINGTETDSLPHIINISFPGTDVEAMLVNLDLAGIAVSSGSACTAGSVEPSHVLKAMYGPNSERLYNSIRFSFGYGNTIEQMKKVALETAKVVRRLSNR